jgi:hypothetical protein
MKTIEIENIGPIHRLSIPVPEEGGVVVLQGPNGAGKSQALNASRAMICGSGSLNKRDGALGNGRVVGFGAQITVGRRTSRTGELDVIGLEDRLNVATLVDPGIANAEAADRQRIKAIVALTGGPASLSMFDSLLADGLDTHLSAEARRASDPLDMAACIKRDMESVARKLEADACDLTMEVDTARASTSGIDLNVCDDEEALRDAHTEAVAQHAYLNATAKSREGQKSQAAQRKEHLDQAVANYTGPTLEAAQKSYDEAKLQYRDRLNEVDRLTAELQRAKTILKEADHQQTVAGFALQSANSHFSMVSKFEAALATPIQDGPTQDELHQAKAAIEAASNALASGMRIRDAKKALELANTRETQAQQLRAKVEALRAAGKGVDAILSRSVNCDSLKVVDGRLVTNLPGRGETYFGELSAGQRWKIALDLAIDAVGERGVLVLPQDAWEALDPDNRQMIAQHVKGRKVTILTAQAARGDLRAEVFEGGAAEMPAEMQI